MAKKTEAQEASSFLWSKLYIAVGTYDGALAGWELQRDNEKADSQPTKAAKSTKRKTTKNRLSLTFATASHDGSVRCLCFASPTSSNHDNTASAESSTTLLPGALLSCGFDEMLRTHDWSKRKTGLGEVRTPSDFGTPLCASFAPPPPLQLLPTPPTASFSANILTSTHALVGFSQGKIVIYRKRDWTIQHVLAGHVGGVSTLAVHPSGKLALSGGQSDGKLKLWDLTKGRLAYATNAISIGTTNAQQHQTKQQRRSVITPAILSLVWSPDGTAYGFCHGTHITVRHVESGIDLLDVNDMPSRVNQITLLAVDEGLFVAAACDDGSLPVLAVQLTSNNNDKNNRNNDDTERRAIMAIEPVDKAVAGEERFKCIQLLSDYHVVTANSAGVVSLMSLKGAIQMITKPEEDGKSEEESEDDDEAQGGGDGDPKDVKGRLRDKDGEEEEEEGEEELAVDIIDSVQLGQGTRITCLSVWTEPAWSTRTNDGHEKNTTMVPTVLQADEESNQETNDDEEQESKQEQGNVGEKRRRPSATVNLDSDTIKKARELVTQAKELQRKRDRKRQKKNKKASFA